ncbi:C-type lectin (CTL) or carbohydrate-recognition domain (CRD) [Homalodisca vitripennis]|nr:C-type lectin (CTL) or carbohydrate-recognition domain (CRD) [Homalodisca vitripennis]
MTSLVLNRSAKHYRHRASPDCNTVASFDSSSSESRGGLNRYYRQAWENLHQSASTKAAAAHHPPLRRKETLDREGVRDGSELVVSDVYPQQRNTTDKKRHHHHHHHSHQGGEWRSQHHQHARSPHKTRY